MRAGALEPSAFDAARLAVAAWLRQTAHGVTAIAAAKRYPSRSVRAGWSLTIDVDGVTHGFDLLLPVDFPYDRVRVAATDPNVFLTWPHVEDDNIICLPPFVISAAEPVANAKDALAAAVGLARLVASGGGPAEFEREFVSYWAHQKVIRSTSKDFLTLFNPAGGGRALVTAEFENFVVLADTDAGLSSWLEHARAGKKAHDPGLYLPLARPLTPPYPTTAGALMAFIKANIAPDDAPLLQRPPGDGRPFRLVLGADIDGKRGLIGVSLRFRKTPNGFRSGHIPFTTLMTIGDLTSAKVRRADAVWVHGRGLNASVPILLDRVVTVLGCGALGSMTAVRLAQSGVGAFRLVDHESLETANVGRHALGMADVGRGKAKALADHLLRRFPHLRFVEPYPERWQQSAKRDELLGADLVIAAIGEPGPELLLNEIQLRRGAQPPVVYGWMEAGALAAHALAIIKPTGCLRCVLGDDGYMLSPEIEMDEEAMMASEPACGTFFDPYGPLDLDAAVQLVGATALDVLLGRRDGNHHGVYAVDAQRLAERGARWTAAHLELRPSGFTGALTFARRLPDATACHAGLHP